MSQFMKALVLNPNFEPDTNVIFTLRANGQVAAQNLQNAGEGPLVFLCLNDAKDYLRDTNESRLSPKRQELAELVPEAEKFGWKNFWFMYKDDLLYITTPVAVERFKERLGPDEFIQMPPLMADVQMFDEFGNPRGSATVDLNDVDFEFGAQRQGPPLSAQQRERLSVLWERLGRELHPNSHKNDWIEYFRDHPDPETEIRVFEAVASTIESLWDDVKFSKNLIKLHLIAAVLAVSMHVVGIPAGLKITAKQMSVIRSTFFTALGDCDSQLDLREFPHLGPAAFRRDQPGDRRHIA